jgi:hypothetical protein
LFDEGFLDSVILGHLVLEIFLTLEDRGDIALKLDDFASDGHDRLGADKAAGDGAGKHGTGEEENVTNTHDQDLRKLSMGRGTIWNKEWIEPQLSNVLADWVRGKWD